MTRSTHCPPRPVTFHAPPRMLTVRAARHHDRRRGIGVSVVLALLTAAVMVPATAVASTAVPGRHDHGVDDLDAGGSPYVVQGVVSVGGGATLTVAAGVQVRFAHRHRAQRRGRRRRWSPRERRAAGRVHLGRRVAGAGRLVLHPRLRRRTAAAHPLRRGHGPAAATTRR